jgi:hypothetical protein
MTQGVRDVVFVVLVLAFFAVAVVFVRACELVLRPGGTVESERRE